MFIHPGDIEWFYGGGTGDMAETVRLQREDGSRPAFAIVFVRAHFRGSSSASSATITMAVDSEKGPGWDTSLRLFKTIGGSAANTEDINFRVPVDELMHFVVPAADGLTFTWNNPDDGVLEWGLVVGVIDLQRIPRYAATGNL